MSLSRRYATAIMAILLIGASSWAFAVQQDSAAEAELQPNEIADESPVRLEPEEPAKEREVRRINGQVFAKREKRDLLADVYQPAGDGPFPGVLMIHGGAWMSGSRSNTILHANALARAGYVVVNIDYRLAPVYRFPAQLDDCVDALRWMCSQADELHINRDQLAVYGYSAGAHLACLVGLNFPDDPELSRPKAIVAGGTPADFEWIGDESLALAYFLGGSRQKLPDVYRNASPINHVTADDPPVLLYHGERDSIVPLASAQRLHERLKENNVKTELVTFPRQGHIATFLNSESRRRAIRFLDEVFGR